MKHSRQSATPRRVATVLTALAALVVGAAFVRTVAQAVAAPSLVDGPVTCSTVDPYGKFDCQLPGYPTPSPSASPTPSSEPTPTATPTPSPTPSPTSSPTPTVSPSPTPTVTDWPNAATTGATGTLTLRTGNLTISTAGAVVEGLDIRGCVSITAPNVVFRNSKVTCPNGWAIRAVSTGGVVIDQVDVSCGATLGKGVVGEGFTLRRSDVSGCEDAVYVDRNAIIVDSYLHDLYGGGTDPHNDVIQVSDGGDNVTVRGNFMSNRTPRATSGYMGDGPGMDNIVIDRNYIEAGGYVVYCSSSGVNNVISNNTIDALGYGPWYTTCSRSGIVRTGNILL